MLHHLKFRSLLSMNLVELGSNDHFLSKVQSSMIYFQEEALQLPKRRARVWLNYSSQELIQQNLQLVSVVMVKFDLEGKK